MLFINNQKHLKTDIFPKIRMFLADFSENYYLGRLLGALEYSWPRYKMKIEALFFILLRATS